MLITFTNILYNAKGGILQIQRKNHVFFHRLYVFLPIQAKLQILFWALQSNETAITQHLIVNNGFATHTLALLTGFALTGFKLTAPTIKATTIATSIPANQNAPHPIPAL